MATESVFVDQKFAEVLQGSTQSTEGPFYGFLLSTNVANTVRIIGGGWKDPEKNLQLQYKNLRDSLPIGINISGLFFKTTQASIPQVIKPMLEKLCKSWGNLQQTLGVEEIVLALERSVGEHSALYRYNLASGDIQNLEMKGCTDELSSCSVQVRMRCDLPLSFDLESKLEKFRTNFLNEIVVTEDRIGQSRSVFHVKNSSVLIEGGESGEDRKIKDILPLITREDLDEFSRKKKLKAGNYSQEIIHLDLLYDVSQDKDESNHAPFMIHEHKTCTRMRLNVPIDVVGYADPDAPASTLYPLLISAIKQQLHNIARASIPHYKDQNLPLAKPYHFKPLSLSHLITVVYPAIEEDKLESRRRDIHKTFILPDNQPFVRKLNAFRFPDEETTGGLLVNTHIGLNSPGVPGGKQYLVQGTYSYHHYMQDRFDDNGWGCAYRSLQTLMSWFRHQGYTERLPASHREIQEALVEIGDKEKKFIGSRQWIGSTEVNYVLDHLLGVTSKILFVSSGAELGSKGRELASHFQTQGTPIMIGGGVLAHTILGVEWDEVTGDVRFLILDPHYTGGEDLKVIQDKGWCGWKGPDFWDQNAYYNLCMPQKPIII